MNVMKYYIRKKKSNNKISTAGPFISAKRNTGDFFFQPKLIIGPQDDPYERQADAVSEKVMRMSEEEETLQTKILPETIQRKCAECEEEEKEVRKKDNSTHSHDNFSPDIIHEALNSTGSSLDASTQGFMENRFGYDFDNVRIHTGAVAEKSAQSINALAYTRGNDIVFNRGQYSPGSYEGRKLLAHELTHVVQQLPDPNTISMKEENARQGFTEGADPCTYTGARNREREIHLNLALRAVRVYTGPTAFRQFDNLVVGPATTQLARANGWCHMYPVLGFQRVSGHGLINFVNYCGGFGFHSNFWRQERNGSRIIERIPGAQSAGCARLHDSDSRSTGSGDSNAFYTLVQDSDCVRIYSRSNWRRPTFKPCREDADCTP